MTEYLQAPPGWYPDPSGRYPHRWFDGTDWTATVAGGDGATGVDPAWGVMPNPRHDAAPTGDEVATSAAQHDRTTVAPMVVALIGAGAILLGATVLPWMHTAGNLGNSAGESTLPRMISRSAPFLFVTSRIFWRGAVFGALGLTAMTAVVAAIRPRLRIPAAICAIGTLVWLASATTMVLYRSPTETGLQVDLRFFEDWGSGLWVTTFGVACCLGSTLVPRGYRRAGDA